MESKETKVTGARRVRTSYWTNDDGRPRFLIRVCEGEVSTYRDGRWIENYAIYRKIINGDGVDPAVTHNRAKWIQRVLDRRDGRSTEAGTQQNR